jgi:hypothetical protein
VPGSNRRSVLERGVTEPLEESVTYFL